MWVVNRTHQTSPLLHLNDFKTKYELKWFFQSKERHKTVNRKSWYYWNNLNMSESSILLLLETEFLTSNSCNTLWKKSMHEHMWLIIFVVPRCNYFFVFFLDIFTLKTVNLYAVYVGSHLPGTIKLLHHALIYSSLMISILWKI